MTTKSPAVHDPKTLLRLSALPQPAARLEVDRAYPGRIRNASILTTGPALGHGFEVDKTTVEQVARYAASLRGRWTHGSVSEDGLGRHLGRWETVRLESFRLCRACNHEVPGQTCPDCQAAPSEAWRAVGDFVFAPSAWKLRPDGLDVSAPQYLMDRAEEDPQSLGISIVARFGYEEVEPEEGEPRRLARIASPKDLCRGDWVADPAANPLGLHAGTGGTSEVVELVTRELDQVVRREGRDKARMKALGFLARYFQDDLAAASEFEALEAEVSDLRDRLLAYEEREAEGRAQADQAFLARLRSESTALQAPIPGEDMERVAALLRAGQAEAAKVVGEAFLARSKALGQVAFQRGGALPLVPREEPPAEQASVKAQVSVLARRNLEAELNAEGTKVVGVRAPSERS